MLEQARNLGIPLQVCACLLVLSIFCGYAAGQPFLSGHNVLPLGRSSLQLRLTSNVFPSMHVHACLCRSRKFWKPNPRIALLASSMNDIIHAGCFWKHKTAPSFGKRQAGIESCRHLAHERPGRALQHLAAQRASQRGGRGAAARGSYTDRDLINFLVNVECLEGLFDTWGIFHQHSRI